MRVRGMGKQRNATECNRIKSLPLLRTPQSLTAKARTSHPCPRRRQGMERNGTKRNRIKSLPLLATPPLCPRKSEPRAPALSPAPRTSSNEATGGPNESTPGTPLTSERRTKRVHRGLIFQAWLRVNVTKRGQMRPIFEFSLLRWPLTVTRRRWRSDSNGYIRTTHPVRFSCRRMNAVHSHTPAQMR